MHCTSCNHTRNLRRCSCHRGPFRRPHSPAEPTPLSLAWVATPQPPERSLSTPGPPQRTSTLKRALRRGILRCSLASPPTGALSDHITVQDERRTAPPFTVRGRPTAPVSASAADPGGSRPRYDAGGATPCSVLRAQNSRVVWVGSQNQVATRSSLTRSPPIPRRGERCSRSLAT